MFTGIVTEVGRVHTLRRGAARAALAVRAPGLAGQLATGDSVAVDGVCLTVTGFGNDSLHFDVVTETLGKSTLSSLVPGARVNLEGALRVGDRLSGHFVMGHVDGVGTVVRRADEPGQTVVTVRAPPGMEVYLLEKGLVAMSGVSLTIWNVNGREFSVALVPHTLASTTLADLGEGRPVNLEADILARWIARLLPGGEAAVPPESGVTLEGLRRAGWEV